MAEIVIRDVSSAGHVLGGARVADLSKPLQVRDLLQIRIRSEVAAHALGDTPGHFRGLVQPARSVRVSDGFRLLPNSQPDAERMLAGLDDAIDRGTVHFRLEDGMGLSADDTIEPDEVEQLTVVLERPIVEVAAVSDSGEASQG